MSEAFPSWVIQQHQVCPNHKWLNEVARSAMAVDAEEPMGKLREMKDLALSLLTEEQRKHGRSPPRDRFLINYGPPLKAAPDSHFSCMVGYQVAPMAVIHMRLFKEMLACGVKRPLSVIDANSNVGTSTLLLMLALEKLGLSSDASVTAVELNPETAERLKLNIVTNASTIIRDGYSGPPPVVVVGSCVDYLLGRGIKADLVSFDPPWGGVDYKRHKELPLTLDGISIGTIAGRTLKSNTRVVVTRIPVNTSLVKYQDEIRAEVPSVVFRSYRVMKPNQKDTAFILSAAYRPRFEAE